MTHREAIKEWLANIHLKECYAVDWGVGTKPAKNYIKHDGVHFFTIDKLSHVGADLVADIEQPIKLNRIYDYAFCIEVLEHTWNTNMVIANISNHLKSGGTLFLTIPYNFPTHSDEDYKRYTHIGLKKLFEQHEFEVKTLKPTVGDIETAQGFILEAVKRG